MTVSAQPPRNSNLPITEWAIQRIRLHARLEDSLNYKLTLVSAPPGYGKTTALANFARVTSIPTVWHTLETRERDVLNLHLHFLEAIKQAFPAIDRVALPAQQSIEELGREATDLIRQHIKSDFLYVLDDAQILNGYPSAETWLRVFVESASPNVHLIVISRSTPNLPLTEMIARSEVQGIGIEQLRFSQQELSQLAHKLNVDEDTMQRMGSLLDTLEGWPAGAVLALQPLPETLKDALPTSSSGPEALFNALAESMLRAQAPQLRDFLLASSTFTRMTPELCNRVLGYNNSTALFDQIAKKNLFVSRSAGGMFYHKLFRIFLQRHLYNNDPNLFASYHLRAGMWFEENRDLEEAFDHFIAGNTPDYAKAIAERMAETYFKQGRHETLLAWHHKLSTFNLPIPWLRYTSAMIHIDRLGFDHALQALKQAAQDFRIAEDGLALAKVRFQQAQIALRQGHVDESIRIAESLTEWPDNKENLLGRAQHMLGVANLRKGAAQPAADYMEHAVPLFRNFGDSYALSVVLQDLHLAYVRLGRTEDATKTLHEVIAMRRSLQSPGPLGMALNLLGWHFHRHGFYAEALSTLNEGLEVVVGISDPNTEGYLLWSMADLLRDCGQFAQAEAHYTRALEAISDAEPVLRCSLLINFAIQRRWQQDSEAACKLAEEALHLADRVDAVAEKLLADAVLRAAEVELGNDPDLVLHDIQAVADSLREKNALVELVYVMALCADIALLMGNQGKARQTLRDALSIADKGGGRQPLLAEAVNNKRFNRLVESEGSQMQDFLLARDNLANVVLTPDTEPPSTTPAPLTYNLRVHVLGREMFERDGEVVPPSDWESARAREIFLHLLFRGPQSRDQVGLHFWPDKSAKEVRSNFQTNVHRARSALGRNAIIHDNGFYMVDPHLDIWCDAIDMEELVRQARLLSSHTAYAEGLWQAAADLYQGDFLPTMNGDWVDFRRSELQAIYFEALTELGGCMRIRGAYIDAIAVCQQVLLNDPYYEEAHREIMRCHAQRGEIGNVLKQYRQLENALRDELGAAPSKETTTLKDHLTNTL